MSTLLNFAYGSNMLWQRIADRVPGARPIEPATLRGYELRWHKIGQDGSAKCDIAKSARPDRVVHGVLYKIPRAGKHLLDAAEGLGFGYDEREVVVEVGGKAVSAWAYYATRTDPRLLPFTWYKAFVVAGAEEHGLPAEYIRSLKAVDAAEDGDVGRAERNFSLLDVDWRGRQLL